jgi:nitroreductase
MELWDALRRRKSVRSYSQEPVPPDVLGRVLDSVLRAPSAGFTQGNEFLVISDPAEVAWFWDTIDDPTNAMSDDDRSLLAPVVVIPLAHKDAYLARYSAPDKEQFGLSDEERWPVPFWYVDAGMASMCILLAAVDEGLGAWFFGFAEGEAAVLEHFGVPPQFRPAGAIALGWPAPSDPLSAGSSARTRRRRTTDELVHRNGW